MLRLRWASYALVWAAALTTSASDPGASAPSAGLLEALEAALAEDDARALLSPFMDDLKSLDSQVIEKVVMRQWWGLARDVVAKSHAQQVDLSFAVRKAVRALKDEADELLRTLNPKYGQAQQVSPAFQWAQNDSCVFLTIKYTVRWNAPGALEVTDASVNMSGNAFNFTGLGKHSNNKYKYALSLNLFDLILSASSSWNAASVGKLSVTLRKKWPRKWPRLLANKKAKISNMHVWMEMQEKLDSTLGGMTTVSNSPITCWMLEKLYCLATDTCKKAENCSQCPGKTLPQEEQHICTGMPTEKATLSFKDADMDEHQLGGEAKITKARNEFDIDRYVVYFGKDEHNKLENSDGTAAFVGEATPTGADTEIRIPFNTAIPESATHLLVFSQNEHGEFSTPGSVLLKDAVLPKGKPASVTFEDEDADKGEVSGTLRIGRAADETQVDEYAVHWGKSTARKIAQSSLIRDLPKGSGNELTHYITRGTKIPDGATHILVFTKNEHGENPSPVSLKIVDNTKPCLAQGDPDCPAGVRIGADEDPDPGQAQVIVSIDKAKSDSGLSDYAIYWGRQSCADGGQSGAKNGHIKDVPAVGGSLDIALPADTPVPADSNHILVFSKNKHGESDHCVSATMEGSYEPLLVASSPTIVPSLPSPVALLTTDKSRWRPGTESPIEALVDNLEAAFQIRERGSNVMREVRAGVVTWLTMSYIVVVNPMILSSATAGGNPIPFQSACRATCFSAAFASGFVGLWANLPFGLAAGMGLNSYLRIGVMGTMGLSPEAALACCFVQAVLFAALAASGVADYMQALLPPSLKSSITVAIGIFQAFFGFQLMGLVVKSDRTFVDLGDLSQPTLWLSLAATLLVAALLVRKTTGALLVGICFVTVASNLLGLPNSNDLMGEVSATGSSSAPVWIGLDFGAAFGDLKSSCTAVLCMLFIVVFDTAGVQHGIGQQAGLLDQTGRLPGACLAYMGSALGTGLGALLGTSPVIIHNESAAGVHEGGRTGLCAVTTAILFLASPLLVPLVELIPPEATAPCLVLVGTMMMVPVKDVDFTDLRVAVPAFLIICVTPLTFSISAGIFFGIASYVLLSLILAGADAAASLGARLGRTQAGGVQQEDERGSRELPGSSTEIC